MTIHGNYSLSLIINVKLERIVLDLESEAMRGLGSIPTGGNILSLDFFLFLRSKDKNANIVREKLTWFCQIESVTRIVSTTIFVSSTFDLFNVTCKQHHWTALNPFSNGHIFHIFGPRTSFIYYAWSVIIFYFIGEGFRKSSQATSSSSPWRQSW